MNKGYEIGLNFIEKSIDSLDTSLKALILTKEWLITDIKSLDYDIKELKSRVSTLRKYLEKQD